jgi:hypothetical protein
VDVSDVSITQAAAERDRDEGVIGADQRLLGMCFSMASMAASHLVSSY